MNYVRKGDKLVPAPKDNKHAQKYDPKKEMRDILKELQENEDILTLGQVLLNKPYSYQMIDYWYKNNKLDLEVYDKICGILETRMNIAGLKGEVNTTMCILNLKNKYKWTDKTEVDQNTNITGNIEPIKIEFVDK